MNTYTFKVITRDKESNLFDIFSKSVVDKDINYKYLQNIVKDGEEGRLDRVSKRIYGTSGFVEELMMINNIVNPFTIQVGDAIFFVPVDYIAYYRETEEKEENTEKLANPKNKNTRKDPTRQKGVPPTIRPLDFKQILVDRKSNTIKLNTKLS